MPIFIIRTDESVEGTYRVEAESEVKARAKFGDPGTDWDGVEQIDYMAYSRDLISVEKE